MRRYQASTLVEVVVAIAIFAIVVLGMVPLLGAIRGTAARGPAQLQGLGLIEGRMNALLADLALGYGTEGNSPLLCAMPKDFTKRWLTATGIVATPWALSASAAYDSVSVAGLSGCQMETTVQYYSDPADVNPGSFCAYIVISVRLVPTQSGAINYFPTLSLQTKWYRNPVNVLQNT